MKATTKLYKFFKNLFKSNLEDDTNTNLDSAYLSDCGVEDNRNEVAQKTATRMAAKSRGAEYFEDRLTEEDDLINEVADKVQDYYKD